MNESQLTGQRSGGVLEMFGFDVDYSYAPPSKERKVALNLRVEESLRRNLEALLTLWRAVAIARGENPKAWDLTEVIKRLLNIGIDSAFAQIYKSAGLERMPVSEAEWAKFKAALEATVAEHTAASKKSRR